MQQAVDALRRAHEDWPLSNAPSLIEAMHYVEERLPLLTDGSGDPYELGFEANELLKRVNNTDGIAILKAAADAEGLPFDHKWLRRLRGSLVLGGMPVDQVDAMSVAEFAERVVAPRGATPSVRLTETDRKILGVIDEHGSVASQTDLLNKLSDAGHIMDQGTVKPRLAELKAQGVLIAANGTRGYRRSNG